MDFEDYVATILNSINDSGIEIKYPEPIFEEKMLATRDGVKLATDIFLPAQNGSFPTIVQRGCYAAQDPLNKLIGKEFAKRGFAYVFQFCRGIGRSEGEWVPKVHERLDGKDLVDWLQDQTWVESMGYYGSSYLAMTGWAIADIVPDKMKTMFLSNYGVHDYLANYHDGILKPDITTSWAMDNAGWKVDADYLTSAKYRPALTADVDLWGGKLPWYRDVLQSTTEDSHYWSSESRQTFKKVAAKIKIPMFISEGWYDHHLENALMTYAELSDDVKSHSILQIGGWNHFGQAAVFDRPTPNMLKNEFRTLLSWLTDILIDQKLPTGKIQSYEIGADKWHEEKVLPVTSSPNLTFYLNHESGQPGTLISDKDKIGNDNLAYTFDPDNPVPSIGGEVLLKTADQIGSRLQPKPNYRNDVVSFISEPLNESKHLWGNIGFNINVATDVDDTAFVIKISEILADGRTFNIRTTISTLSAKNPNYQAGETMRLQLQTLPIDWQLNSGSRIRVDITSSDFPQYQIHSNFKGNQSEQATVRVAHQQIIIDPNNSSTVTLPITNE
ncbi:CocE/NonD family hydrolase [Companilactobacillus nantensis]|uniref:Xaa-Pro dipeptidyl-peptidase C-terminal domain-containing protein n=1 Tax=Companilactobacillus nantensis DSM 16982 TaxID=1423774 RepID=A0A0R1WBC4_9LACO|nr:CocE/NonD family hydrolase [Companilactobacillus nantensis]KRM15272.1 hypothetical protein FD31_GL001280 [Companilactobacillus nantensis DSM 16982]GEO64399.1 putative peptidase [Companilactobacillus nantensis]